MVEQQTRVKDDEDVSEEMEETDGVEKNEDVFDGYTCPDCPKSRRYATMVGLRRHRQIFCSKSKLIGKRVQCDWCKKTFKKEKYLINHIKLGRCRAIELQHTKITKEDNKCDEDDLASSSTDDINDDQWGS